LIERHHVTKRDAPSGTARALAATLTAAGRSVDPADVLVMRTGDIVGEHRVEFNGPGERLILEHCATNRDLFARGALDAATWLSVREPGRYRIEDVFLPA
jgi:4-hydroxy-tetrahydrodipicolinate reductase